MVHSSWLENAYIQQKKFVHMPFRFEDLQVWQKAIDPDDQINQLTKSFPRDELFVLVSQIKKAADSVVLNIAEGSTGQTKAVFKVF